VASRGRRSRSRSRGDARVHDDETLTEEGKKQAAQRIIDRYARQARQHYAEAREKAARVKITKTSFFELMRNVKAGRLSEEDAWQRFQEEAG
jgi:hypothetical protein